MLIFLNVGGVWPTNSISISFVTEIKVESDYLSLLNIISMCSKLVSVSDFSVLPPIFLLWPSSIATYAYWSAPPVKLWITNYVTATYARSGTSSVSICVLFWVYIMFHSPFTLASFYLTRKIQSCLSQNANLRSCTVLNSILHIFTNQPNWHSLAKPIRCRNARRYFIALFSDAYSHPCHRFTVQSVRITHYTCPSFDFLFSHPCCLKKQSRWSNSRETK